MMQGPPQWGPNPYTRAPVYDDFYTGFDDFNRGPAPGGYGSGGFPPMQSQIPPLPPISSSVSLCICCMIKMVLINHFSHGLSISQHIKDRKVLGSSTTWSQTTLIKTIALKKQRIMVLNCNSK